MSMPPKTVLEVSAEEVEAIRHAVRTADVATLGEGRARADLTHVEGLVALLADERVSGPIYDLPRPINAETVTRWVVESQAMALAGEALLIVNLDAESEVAGYSRITVWPDRSAAELAGAIRADRQNSGQGGRGFAVRSDRALIRIETRQRRVRKGAPFRMSGRESGWSRSKSRSIVRARMTVEG